MLFNHVVPRFGATYDLTGDGKTVLKGNWGRFYFNPGVNLADAVNVNTSDQYADWNWTDLNGDRVYQEGEETTLIQRVGGTAGGRISADIKNPYTDEASVFVERAVMNDLGVRVGYVWKKDSDGWQRDNANRPLSAFNVPVVIRDPGPDGALGTADDGADIPGFNLNPTNLALPSDNLVSTIDGYEGTYKTFEISTNKRYGHRWSLNASYSFTWTEEYGNIYYNQRFGTAVPGGSFSHFGSFPQNPNEQTLNEFTNWAAKVSGTVDAGWGLRVTPVLKMQSGAPYGRTITGAFNYNASQILLAEPIGTRRQENVTVLDFRVEKQLRFGAKARTGLFFDVFNVANSNTNININWRSGAAFDKATTVIPPRIAKFGVKFDW